MKIAARTARCHLDRFTLLLIGLSLLGAALVLARTATYGVALEADQVNYIGVARSLLAGDGFSNVLVDEGYYTWRPPLYPILLAAASFGIFDPYDVAAPLNAVIFGLTVFVIGQYFRQHLASRFLLWWACIAVVTSIPLTWLASHALSGALLVLMATLALTQTHKYLNEGKTSTLLWAAIFSALAWQTRYIGISVPATVGLLLLFQTGATIPQKSRRIALYSLIVAAPMGIWLLRNYIRIGEFTGAQRPVDYSAGDILSDIAAIFVKGWERIPPPLADISPALAAAILSIAAIIILIPSGIITVKNFTKTGRHPNWLTPTIFSAFALVYFAALIAGIVSGNTYYGIETRYLFPLYLPILTAAVWAVDHFLSGAKKTNTAGLPAGLVMAGLCILAVGMTVMQVREISRANSFGHNGFSNQVWTGSDVLQYIRDNPLTGLVYSNQPFLIYIYTDEYAAGNTGYNWLPWSVPPGYITGEPVDGRKQLRQWIKDAPEGAYVVWFSNWYANYVYDYSDAEMWASPSLAPVADLPDGAIFRVRGQND